MINSHNSTEGSICRLAPLLSCHFPEAPSLLRYADGVAHYLPNPAQLSTSQLSSTPPFLLNLHTFTLITHHHRSISACAPLVSTPQPPSLPFPVLALSSGSPLPSLPSTFRPILRPWLSLAPHSAAPSHLSSLHLPATNHNLFTTPRAHSTTLLAPIADLFIPDNAEDWRL